MRSKNVGESVVTSLLSGVVPEALIADETCIELQRLRGHVQQASLRRQELREVGGYLWHGETNGSRGIGPSVQCLLHGF